MPFAPGTPKPTNSGRKKGTRNKLTMAALERLAELGVDPLRGMAEIAIDINAPLDLRAKMFSELAQYLYPKRKAIEHSGPDGTALQFTLKNLDAILDRLRSRDRQ